MLVLALGALAVAAQQTVTLPTAPRRIDSVAIVWTERRHGRIERANIDGTNVQLMVGLPAGESTSSSSQTQEQQGHFQLQTPRSVVVHTGQKRLFFIDSGRDIIASVDFAGTNERILVDASAGVLQSPDTLALDEEVKNEAAPGRHKGLHTYTVTLSPTGWHYVLD